MVQEDDGERGDCIWGLRDGILEAALKGCRDLHAWVEGVKEGSTTSSRVTALLQSQQMYALYFFQNASSSEDVLLQCCFFLVNPISLPFH